MLLKQGLDEVGLIQAALIYIVIYAVRPLVLFPATLLTIASGLIFGPGLAHFSRSLEKMPAPTWALPYPAGLGEKP